LALMWSYISLVTLLLLRTRKIFTVEINIYSPLFQLLQNATIYIVKFNNMPVKSFKELRGNKTVRLTVLIILILLIAYFLYSVL
jgi:hypothetical protein